VSVVNKGAPDLPAQVECEKHDEAVRGETGFGKRNSFPYCIGSKSDEAVLTAEEACSFHAVKHHSVYKAAACTSVHINYYYYYYYCN
jgi:hypothetical protein